MNAHYVRSQNLVMLCAMLSRHPPAGNRHRFARNGLVHHSKPGLAVNFRRVRVIDVVSCGHLPPGPQF